VFHDLFQKGKGDSIIFRNLPAKGHLFLYWDALNPEENNLLIPFFLIHALH
jgi:hypothetical protein